MKRFSKLQIAALAALTLVVVVLAIAAFATADNLSRPTVDIAATPTSTPEIVYIELADPTPSTEPIPTPTQQPTASFETSATAVQTSAPTVNSGDAFTLTISTENIGVASGVEEDTLEDGPGWLTTSASPGQDGVCIIYGHRNRNHLKALKNVDYGDSITVTMPEGAQYVYEIESIEIIASDDELRIPTLDGKHLMLVTCYPFYYTGHAPEKYVLLCSLC